MIHLLTITECDVCGKDRVKLEHLPKPRHWDKLMLLDTCTCERTFEPPEENEDKE